jgi:hypothetical protein
VASARRINTVRGQRLLETSSYTHRQRRMLLQSRPTALAMEPLLAVVLMILLLVAVAASMVLVLVLQAALMEAEPPWRPRWL